MSKRESHRATPHCECCPATSALLTLTHSIGECEREGDGQVADVSKHHCRGKAIATPHSVLHCNLYTCMHARGDRTSRVEKKGNR